MAQVSGCQYPCEFRPRLLVAGIWMLFLDYWAPMHPRWLESMESVRLSSPPLSGQLSPTSPQTVAWENLGDSSVPLSPNRVQAGLSQDFPDEGNLFHVLPVSPGFLMRPSGATGQHLQAGVLLPTIWTILVTRFLVTRLRTCTM